MHFPIKVLCAVFCPKTIGWLKRRELQLISIWFGTVNEQILFQTPWSGCGNPRICISIASPSCWSGGNKDKKRTGGQHRENKNVNENDSLGGYSDKKNSVKWCYLLVVRYLQSLVDLVVVLIKQGMSKSTEWYYYNMISISNVALVTERTFYY